MCVAGHGQRELFLLTPPSRHLGPPLLLTPNKCKSSQPLNDHPKSDRVYQPHEPLTADGSAYFMFWRKNLCCAFVLFPVVASVEYFNMFGGFLAKARKAALELLNVSTRKMTNQKNCFQTTLVTKEQPGTKAEPIGGQFLRKISITLK